MSTAETLTIQTGSVEETLALGRALGESLVGGLVIGLCGPLGSGKTQLVKGIALGNAVSDVRQVTSPTFTLLQEYPGRLTLFHLDAYRLPNPAALAALGFDELIRPDSVVIVEWADRAGTTLPTEMLWVDIQPTGESVRNFDFRAIGNGSRDVVTRLKRWDEDSHGVLDR